MAARHPRRHIATRHIWSPADFCSPWVFLDHAVLAPGSSLGYHYHDALEECFLILGGQGYLTLDDQTFAVEPGSVTWQGIGQHHGLYNPTAEPLTFLRVAIGIRGEQYTTIDLHDDLRDRQPSS
jgi:mannose-6-phosphate isomerase-like protein (cupin superfamily)